MALEWVDVADSAVKIGLGALITIVGGWIRGPLRKRKFSYVKRFELNG